MATQWSVMVLLAGLSGVFHKTAPKFPVDVCTTVRVCLPAMHLQGDAANKIHFLLRFSTVITCFPVSSLSPCSVVHLSLPCPRCNPFLALRLSCFSRQPYSLTPLTLWPHRTDLDGVKDRESH